MGNNANLLPIDTPSTYEVQKDLSQLTDRDLGFAKEKNQYHTAIDLTNQEKEIALATVEENTKNATDDLAESSDNEYQDILHNLPSGLQDIDKQLRFTARRGKTKEIRHIAREYRKEFVKDMKYTCYTLGIYFRKVRNGRFDENMITPVQMQILNAKVQARHDKTKGFIGDTLTGDNVLAERGNKKDNFVGPDMNIGTDGVEWRGTYTSEQANEMANGCCQPQTAERKKKYYGMIDKNVNIPILSNTGNQVLRSGMKILPDIVRLGVGIKYGIDTVKGIFGLFSADGRKPDALRKLTKSASILGLVAFTDIDKAVNYVGGWFSNATKNYSSNGTSSIGSNRDIIEGLSNLKAGESIPYGYGETLMGKAFAVPGVTIGEINQEQIITYNGNRPVGINFSRLKKMYSEKMNNNQADIPKYTQAINNVNDLEKAYNQLKTREQREAFMDTMTAVGMSKEVLENTAIADKPIALFMASTMKTAEVLPELGQRLVITDKLSSDKEVESYLSNYGKEKFIDEVMKLPDNIRLGIEKGEILFTIENGKLIINAHGEKAGLDLATKKLSLYNKAGELKEFTNNGATDTVELITVIDYSLRSIKEHKGKFMINNPMFFSKPYGDWGHKICATLGGREWLKPGTRVSGRSVTILDGSYRFGDDGLSKFKEDNVMTQYAEFLNSLGIRKGDNADTFIQNNLKKQIELQYPTMNPSEREQLLQTSLGIITNRGSLEPLVYNTKEKVTGKIGDIYTDITTILGDGGKKLKEAGKKIVGRSVVGGVLTLRLASNAVKTIRDFLGDLYPESIVKYMKDKYSQGSEKNRGILGTASNAVTNFLLGITLFGENKIQKTEENDKQQTTSAKQEEGGFDPLKNFKKNVKTGQESVK